MHKAIDDMHASFNIYFGKQLSLTNPNFGLEFLKEIQNQYDSNAMKPDMTLEKLELLVTSLVEPHHKI
jgi:hypothetical protein